MATTAPADASSATTTGKRTSRPRTAVPAGHGEPRGEDYSTDPRTLRRVAVAVTLRPYALLATVLMAMQLAQLVDSQRGVRHLPTYVAVLVVALVGAAAIAIFAAPERMTGALRPHLLAAALIALLYGVQGVGMLRGSIPTGMAGVPSPLLLTSLMALAWPVWVFSASLGVTVVLAIFLTEPNLPNRSAPLIAVVSVAVSLAVVVLRRRALAKQALRNATLAEEQRQAAETGEQLRSVTESAWDGIVILDERGRITQWNAAMERLLGYPSAQVIGEPLSMFVDPQQRDHVAELYERIVAGEEPELLNSPVIVPGWHRDQVPVQVELTMGRWESGRSRYFTCVVRDISDRLNAESSRLEADARAQRERQALLLQEEVVQLLVVSLYALDEGDHDMARECVAETLRAAQSYVTEVLADVNLADVLTAAADPDASIPIDTRTLSPRTVGAGTRVARDAGDGSRVGTPAADQPTLVGSHPTLDPERS